MLPAVPTAQAYKWKQRLASSTFAANQPIFVHCEPYPLPMLQLLEWWYTQAESKLGGAGALPPPPPPPAPRPHPGRAAPPRGPRRVPHLPAGAARLARACNETSVANSPVSIMSERWGGHLHAEQPALPQSRCPVRV